MLFISEENIISRRKFIVSSYSNRTHTSINFEIMKLARFNKFAVEKASDPKKIFPGPSTI
jgi:hypothetical protein